MSVQLLISTTTLYIFNMSSSFTHLIVITAVYLSVFQTMVDLNTVEAIPQKRVQDSRPQRGSPPVIHFEDEYKIKECPGGKKYCETADDYPKEEIKRLLDRNSSFNVMFFVEKLPSPTDRFGIDETELCESVTSIIRPQKVQREGTNDYLFVVNDDTHEQGIRVEECRNPKGNCFKVDTYLPLGYVSYCEQKHATRVIAVVEQKNGRISGIVTEPIRFPSCCACSLKMIALDSSSTLELGDRSGLTGPLKPRAPLNTTSSAATGGASKKN